MRKTYGALYKTTVLISLFFLTHGAVEIIVRALSSDGGLTYTDSGILTLFETIPFSLIIASLIPMTMNLRRMIILTASLWIFAMTVYNLYEFHTIFHHYGGWRILFREESIVRTLTICSIGIWYLMFSVVNAALLIKARPVL